MKTVQTTRSLERPAARRDPRRTRERILAAALGEFASHGLGGARVDAIARRASINKRMLYHYFGSKQGLFREVLRRKMAERAAWAAASPDDPLESLPYWFEHVGGDLDWVRLLEWEALQVGDGRVIDEPKRQAAATRAVKRIRQRQRQGFLARDIDPRHLALSLMALHTFPLAFPQLTRLVTGHLVSDRKFRSERAIFLRRFAAAFRPVPAGNEPHPKPAHRAAHPCPEDS